MVKRWQNLVEMLAFFGWKIYEDKEVVDGKTSFSLNVGLVNLYPDVMKPLKSCKNCCVLQFGRKRR